MKELTKNVKEVARKAGARLVGIAPVERFEKAPKGHRPNDLLKTAQSVISMACVMPYSVAVTAPSASYMTYGYNILNQKLHEMAFAVAWHLEEQGFQSLPMQNTGDVSFMKIVEEWPEPKVFRMGVFSHRHAAVAAGLGEIGMNCTSVSRLAPSMLFPVMAPSIIIVVWPGVFGNSVNRMISKDLRKSPRLIL
jgi:epoxyqueuosine reductase QueG